MRVVFSRNRAAQLDLLLRSLAVHTPAEETRVIWYATTPAFADGYRQLGLLDWTQPWRFDKAINALLAEAEGLVTLFCDDDVVFRDFTADPAEALEDPGMLCFSWRLGSPLLRDGHGAFGSGWVAWDWTTLPRTDHGYPGSIDGHVFRAGTLRELLADAEFGSPTFFETVLERRCEENAHRWPLLAAAHEQALVGVPVNRVSEPSGCPFGERFPQPAEELNRRFLAGERIALERLDFTGVDGCHHEIPFVWEPA